MMCSARSVLLALLLLPIGAPVLLACASTGAGSPPRLDAQGRVIPPASQTGRVGRADSAQRPPQVSEADFRQARVHHSLGLANLQEGRVALAIRELRAAAKLNPYDPWIRLALAESYRLKGFFSYAEAELQSALDDAPGFQNARLTLSALYIQMERYEDAIQQAALLIQDPTFPDPWTALTNQGYAQMKLGRHQEARRSLELALDYEPSYWRATLNLGILEAEQGRRLEALRRFEEVLEAETGPMVRAEVNYRMAQIYLALGEREQAVAHLAATRATSPKGPWGKRSEDTLRRLR